MLKLNTKKDILMLEAWYSVNVLTLHQWAEWKGKMVLPLNVNVNSCCKFCAGAARPNIAWTIFLLLRGLGWVAEKSNHFIVYSPIILSNIRSRLKLLSLHVKMYVHCPSDVPFTGQPIAKYWCYTKYFLIATVAWIFRQ